MTLATKIDCKISAQEQIVGDLETTNLAFNDRNPTYFLDGSTAGKANKAWSDTRTLADGAAETLDLNALTDVLSRTINFTKIKTLHIKPDAANTTTLTVGNAGSNPWVGPFDDGTATIALATGDELMLISSTGWACTNGSLDKLLITNASGAAATYDIEIVGA